VDWWQIALFLLLIGVLSVVCGMFVGIPLSKRILRRRNQTYAGKYRLSPKPEPQYTYTTTDQFNDLLKKYMASRPKAEEKDREVTFKRENGETEVGVEQVDSNVIDQLLVELEKNHELSTASRSEKPLPFQTHTWDVSPATRKMLSTNLQWELTQAYVDMHIANNIIWFLSEFDRKSPVLDEQYAKMCNQIAAKLSRIIPMLKTAKQIPT